MGRPKQAPPASSPDNSLDEIDAVVAIGLSGINKGFGRLFGTAAFAEPFKQSGQGYEVQAELGAPQLSFVTGQKRRVRMKTPLTTVQATFKSKSYALKGQFLSLDVDLAQYNDFHDKAFTIAGISLDLNKISNIAFEPVDIEGCDSGSRREIGAALIKRLHDASYAVPSAAADPGQGTEIGMSLGEVALPKVRLTVGPLAPTAAALVVSTRSNPPAGELDFLLMMNGRPLPNAVSREHQGFAELWTAAAGAGHDAALVLTDYLLLESVVEPGLKQGFPGIQTKLTRGENGRASALKLSKPCPIPAHRGMSLTAVGANLAPPGSDAQGRRKAPGLRLELTFEKRERLQTDDGPKGVDFSLVTLKFVKRVGFALEFQIADGGQLTCKVVADAANRNLPKPTFETNFAIRSPRDLLKYLGAPLAALAAPAAAPIVAAAMAAVGATVLIFARAFEMRDYAGGVSSPLEDLTAPLALPGDPVFAFRDPKAYKNLLIFPADYLDPPALSNRRTWTKPGSIKPFPKQKAGKRQPPEDTDAELIGEVALKYRYVHDERYRGSARRSMPYYILRREQYWHRTSNNSYPALREEEMKEEKITRMKSVYKQTIQETLKMEFTAGGTLSFLDGFVPELKAELSEELQISTETEDEREWTETITHTVTYKARKRPYNLAVWILADRFTLLRTDRERTTVGQWIVYNDKSIKTDDQPTGEATEGE